MVADRIDQEELTKLFKKALKGDSNALGGLIDLTHKSLYRFSLYLCNNSQLAEDICQETYIKAFENLKKINEPASFVGWLFKTAKNHYLDHVKSPKNKQKKQIETVENSLTYDVSQERILEIRQCLGMLEESDRALLLMIDMEGLTYEEASISLNISLEALKSRVHRARQAFLKVFNKS